MNVFHELAPELIPLFHGLVLQVLSYVQLWTFHVIPRKKGDFYVC